RQADVLANARVLHNETGTAPGMWIEENEKIYIIMPGVPTEMKYLMQNEVLPKLQGLPNQYAISHRSILTAGIGESFLAEKLHSFEEDLPPHIHLAYLPKFGQVRLRLTGSSLMEQALEKEMEAYSSTLMELVKPYFVGEGDVLLEQQLLTRLKNHQLSLSTAESCTGGYLSHLITSLPGSSAVFKGGVVSYSNELKEQVLGVRARTLAAYGAVSEQVALEMAL